MDEGDDACSDVIAELLKRYNDITDEAIKEVSFWAIKSHLPPIAEEFKNVEVVRYSSMTALILGSPKQSSGRVG